MRTSRLRRWIVRGSLLAATLSLGVAGAQTNSLHDDYGWGAEPSDSVVTVSDTGGTSASDDEIGREENDYGWG